MRQFICIVFVVVMTSVSLALADIVILNDGTKLEGDVKKTDRGWTIATSDGKTIEVSADKVKSIQLGKDAAKGTPERATSDLMSLRRSVENLSDVKAVIDRFNRFIEQNKDTPAATEAQKDLAIWQDRADRGLVKLGNKWISPEERSQYADKALAIAAQARGYVEHGRLHDADPLIAEALENDPQCAPALYLRGVMQFQQNQLPPARKSFDAVNTVIKDHAPTLNNLAVILSRQNATMPSLNHYEQAITAAPVNKFILDNIAEALATVPEDQRKNRVAQLLFRKFTEQDTRLQEALAAQGLYRWGSTWVDRPEMDRLKEIEKQVNEKISKVKSEGEANEKRVNEIDGEIQSIERSLREIESQSIYRDPDGRLVRMPYPGIYYDLQTDRTKLQGERSSLAAKLNGARAEMKRLQNELPKPKFTGIQKLVGAEGTPVMLAPGTEPITPGGPVPDPLPTATQPSK
ncbi:MAG: tetratricopeptide repeat protein [Anaerolineae bacterium]|nr:tetratricopeptide repeat protein [Phycisphaerae bacterium]